MAGEDVVANLISELKSSVESSIKLEGEMIRLTNYASALAMALECVKVCLKEIERSRSCFSREIWIQEKALHYDPISTLYCN